MTIIITLLGNAVAKLLSSALSRSLLSIYNNYKNVVIFKIMI